MSLRGKHVLVTGGDGFVGSNLCEALVACRAHVISLVRNMPLRNPVNGVHVVIGDVLDYHILLQATRHVDIVFHAAALTHKVDTQSEATNVFAVNALGTLNVLLASRNNEVDKFVYISSAHVYGEQDSLPITERNKPRPMDLYSASKLAGEHLCQAFAKMCGMNISLARAFNLYGPRQKMEFLIPSVVIACLKEEQLELRNPNYTRDYSYIEDVVKGYILLAELNEPAEIYNFASGVERTVEQVAADISRIGSFRNRVKWVPHTQNNDGISRSWGDSTKARKKLGWKPEVSFEHGIERTISWYRTQFLSSSTEK